MPPASTLKPCSAAPSTITATLPATGRVIRTETDRGVIVLIDERFTHARYRQLFPAHWRDFHIVQDTREIQDYLARFWGRE